MKSVDGISRQVDQLRRQVFPEPAPQPIHLPFVMLDSAYTSFESDDDPRDGRALPGYEEHNAHAWRVAEALGIDPTIIALPAKTEMP